MTTVLEARRDARVLLAAVETPQLDADVLLMSVLGCRRSELFSRCEAVLGGDEERVYQQLIHDRAAGTPAAYLTGYKEWFGLLLEVDKNVLIPRPETELLATRAIHLIRELGAESVVDVGTGTGALAIAMASHCAGCEVLATDISELALEVAGRNVQRLGLNGKVKLACGSLLEPITRVPDLIVANLPYVSTFDERNLSREVLCEPATALFAGQSGLEVISNLLLQLAGRQWLCPIALEIGASQGAELIQLAGDLLPKFEVEVTQDLNGFQRVAILAPR